MFKYLLIALVVIWLFYSPALRGKRAGGKPSAKADTPKAETMVQCAHCGVHLPEGEASTDEMGLRYCSASHRQAGPRNL
ncbi:MAG: hypothetical protein HYX44_09305 [Aquabacterium sp.]|nr:hypothetical protein [Aquabacterium sp.]